MAVRVVILAGALSLAACGDDSDDDPETEADAGGTEDTGTSSDTGSTADTGATEDAGGATDTGGGETDPTLTNVYTNVFAESCGGAACHLDGQQNGINLDNDGALHDRLMAVAPINGMPYVTPNDVDNSYLWHKCLGTQASVGGSGSRMPIGPQLSSDQLDLLEAWIDAGAPND